jgi:ATP-dependent Lon protease
MSEALFVRQLPDCFNMKWGFVLGLALPICVIEKLVEKTREEEEARVIADRTTQDRRENAYSADEVATSAAEPVSSSKCIAHWKCSPQEYPEVATILDKVAVEEAYAVALLAIRDSDVKQQIEGLIKEIRSRGETRRLLRLPTNWRQSLDELEARFPNFGAFLDSVRQDFAISEAEDGVVNFDPMLLNGSPGVGKSYFCEEFARYLGSPITRINMESAQESGSIVGSSEYWSNSKPGRIFEALIYRDFANPVIIVEEIEKSTADRYNPLNALLGLMERKTAATFFDQSYPWLSIDASRIIWICTANNAALLPGHLRSRIRQFDIPDPTKEQAESIVRGIFNALRIEYPKAAAGLDLSLEALALLSTMAPRRARLALKAAMGRAIYKGSACIAPSDIGATESASCQRQIGFA